MKEIFTQWKYTKMVVLTALTAAIYVAVMMPFKIATIIPGFTEIRPGVVVPVVFGMFFGPAGAWGAAIGNLIGDIFGGMLTIISPYGFVGNFLLGFMGYKLMEKWGWLKGGDGAYGVIGDEGTFKKVIQFLLIVVLSSSACSLVISWGMDVHKVFPFAVFSTIVFFNNLVMPAILGVILIGLLARRLNRWDLVWVDIMDEKDRSVSRFPKLGGALMWIGAVGGLVLCFAVSVGIYNADFLVTENLAPGQMEGLGGTGVPIIGLVALVIILIGAIL
jgi:energy-coupling factor transport system substrate-specific component